MNDSSRGFVLIFIGICTALGLTCALVIQATTNFKQIVHDELSKKDTVNINDMVKQAVADNISMITKVVTDGLDKREASTNAALGQSFAALDRNDQIRFEHASDQAVAIGCHLANGVYIPAHFSTSTGLMTEIGRCTSPNAAIGPTSSTTH